MRKKYLFRNERGSIWSWLGLLAMLIILGVGAFLMVIKIGLIDAPEFLADQAWMESFLPVEDETEGTDEPIVLDSEDNLRQQLVIRRREVMAAEATITTLEQQIAAMEQEIQSLEDEIARLMDTINLARSQNISNVALMYENMDPSDAATLLENLGAQRASLILAEMRESKAADVLALIEELMATEITQLLAGFEEAIGAGSTMSGGTANQPPVGVSPRAPSTPD